MISALFSTLGDFNKDWYNEHVVKSNYYGAVQWIKRTSMSNIEVVWLGQIHIVHFPVNDLCRHVLKESLDQLVETVERTNGETKLRGFLEQSDTLMIEAEHQAYLERKGVRMIFSGENLVIAKDLSYYLALMINFVLLLGYRYSLEEVSRVQILADSGKFPQFFDRGDQSFWTHQGPVAALERNDHNDTFLHGAYFDDDHSFSHSHWTEADADPDTGTLPYSNVTRYINQRLTFKDTFLSNYASDSQVESLVKVLGTMQTIAAGFILAIFLVVKVPPAAREYNNAILVLVNTPTGYYVGYFITALIGVTMSYPLLSIHLLDVIVRDELTKAVVNAVVYPRKQLMMTAVLGGFILYIYAVLVFFWYPANESDNCITLARCTTSITNFGVRNGEIAQDIEYSIDEPEWTEKNFFFDTTYFWIITVVLLNIIFGIIVDTFGDLRGQESDKYEDMSNLCFVCNIDRNSFERENIKFNTHIKEQHNMWAYLKFLIHLRTKEEDEYNGLEDYVAACLEKESIDWLPVNRASVLVEEAEDDFEAKTKEMMEEKIKEIQIGLSELARECKRVQLEVEEKRDQFEDFSSEMKEVEEILGEVK
jgi:hypothetical protein